MRVFASFCIFLFVFGCSTPSEKKELKSHDITHVKLGMVDSKLIDSDFFNGSESIILESNQFSMLKIIDRIFIDENKLFVFDAASDKLVCFDKNGKYLKHIQNVGRGPNEYSSLMDVVHDIANKRLLLITDYPYSILTYDYEFNLIDKVTLDDLYLSGVVADKSLILLRSELENMLPSDFYLDIYDLKTKSFIESRLPIDANDKGLYNQTGIFRGKQVTSSTSALITTKEEGLIYEFSSGDAKLKYVIDFSVLRDEPTVWRQIANPFETENYLLFNATDLGILVYDKNINELTSYTQGVGNFNYLGGATMNRFIPIGGDNNLVAFVYDPALMKQAEKNIQVFKEQNKDVQVNNDYLDFAKAVDINSNKIIFFYSVK